MQPLNYCRQLVKQSTALLSVPSVSKTTKQLFSNVIDLAQASQKFLLPDGGRLFDDKEFRALDENESLRLPFPFMALEYHAINIRGNDAPAGYEYDLGGTGKPKPFYDAPNAIKSSKRIVFARERDDWIVITPAFYKDFDGTWAVLPECAIPRVDYLERTLKSTDGRVGIKFSLQNPDMPFSDYADELGALLCFLNALQCANVKTERSDPKKGAKVKGALPFDSYYVLTIDSPSSKTDGHGSGAGRSPREHLRRGHIRHYENGLRIWVNATVVAAGSSGKITKDYCLRAALRGDK